MAKYEKYEGMSLPDPDRVQYYEQLTNRTMWIVDEIDDSLYSVIEKIIRFNREDAEAGLDDPYDRQPIKLIIASPGGLVDNARSLVSIMAISQTPIITIGIGQVASAASMIFLAGHKRIATKNTYFVFHNGSCENLSGTFAELRAFMMNYEKEIEELSEFYKEYTSFDPEYIDEKLNEGDWYIRIDEAIKCGIVDEVTDDISIFF